MKKNVCNFLAVLCLLMGVVTMVSCSKDDDIEVLDQDDYK